jgi:Lrp/AsnC family leucine-responsive transcriptional regulator
MKLDDYDCKILKALQRDSRQSNLALAEQIGLSPTPCLRRVRQLEKAGIIKSYGLNLDRQKLGLGLTVFVGVRVARHQDSDAADFVETVTCWPEVLSCHLLSGDVDFLLEVVAADMQAYEQHTLQALLRIKSVHDVRSNFAMRTHKTHGSLPV